MESSILNAIALVFKSTNTLQGLDSASAASERATDDHTYALRYAWSAEVKASCSVVSIYNHDRVCFPYLHVHGVKSFVRRVCGDNFSSVKV